MKQLYKPILILLALTFCYTYPGSLYMLQGREDITLSDDTDPSTIPFGYQGLINTFRKNPSYFFYGAVLLEKQGLEGPEAVWFPWVERWGVILLSPFLPVEQINAGIIFVIIFFSGFLMYTLARYLQWKPTIALALAVAWAFNPYTRARAKVHGMLAGTFHVPAIFLGLFLVARGKSWKSVTLGAALFLISAMTAHYYVVVSAFWAPMFLVFFYTQKSVREDWKKATVRLVTSLAPAALFLAFNLMVTSPSDISLAKSAIPQSGKTTSGELHPFLSYFSARPIDFVSGDIAAGPKDLNPIRGAINRYVLGNLDKSNPHERSNGIRWIVLFLAISCVYYLIAKPNLFTGEQKRFIWFFTAFGILTMWSSMSPNIPIEGMGLSALVNKFVSQIRVPSRAGIFLNFSCIMLAGLLIQAASGDQPQKNKSRKGKKKKEKASGINSEESKLNREAAKSLPKFFRWTTIPWLLLLIVVLELPPFLQNPAVSKVRPAYTAMAENPNCGAGMHFPFTSPSFAMAPHYHFIQRMRKSQCLILNQSFDPENADSMLKRFAFHPQLFKVLKEKPELLANSLVSFAKCLPMTWIVFDEQIPDSFIQNVCHKLNWKIHPERSCTSEDLTKPMAKQPKEC